MAKGDNIYSRLITFAIQIVKICDKVPATRAGNHVAGQLLRCGTAPAAHYAEARGAESDRDFIHKLRLAIKELNESRAWLAILAGSDLLPQDQFRTADRECEELCRILSASIATIQKRLNN
jgi:four helix bundle protein